MVESAYGSLRGDIVTGNIAPGEQLVEMTLAKRYGVSRTPIREALRRLEQDGLIERIGRRMRVRLHEPAEILDIFDVRIILEVAAARRAAQRHTARDLTLLARAHDVMLAVVGNDTAARVRTNHVFHEQLWAASHSNTLIDLLNRLQMQLLRYPDTTLTYPGRWPKVLAEHEALLAAIREARADEAGRIAAEHLEAAREIRRAMFADRASVDALR